jgi:exosome complex RNA-binding protein Rrp4
VQSFFGDGGVALHTRSAKYGRLSRGQLVCVPPVLIKRLKQHFCSLPAHGVDLVLGCNGWVWVQARATVHTPRVTGVAPCASASVCLSVRVCGG